LLLNISNIGQPEFARTQLICYRLGNRILQTWGFSNFHMTIRRLHRTWLGIVDAFVQGLYMSEQFYVQMAFQFALSREI